MYNLICNRGPDGASSHAAVKLGKALFPLFALALNLPETFFDDKVPYTSSNEKFSLPYDPQTKHSAALMKLLHYPPQTGPIDERVIGIGAHTE